MPDELAVALDLATKAQKAVAREMDRREARNPESVTSGERAGLDACGAALAAARDAYVRFVLEAA